MFKRLSLLAFTVLLVLPATLFADDFIKMNVPLQLGQLKNSNFAIMVVTILEVDDKNSNYGNPPTGRMRIDRVIRGRGIALREVNFELAPPVRYRDKMGDGGIRPEWYMKELPPPPVGESFIAFSYLRGKILRGEVLSDKAVRLEYPLVLPTPTNIELVEGRMSASAREVWQQATLAGVCLVASIIGFLLHVPFISRKLPGRMRRLLAFMFSTLAIVSYGLYEMGISPYAAIRIDLLVLAPAMAACLFALAWSFVRRRP